MVAGMVRGVVGQAATSIGGKLINSVVGNAGGLISETFDPTVKFTQLGVSSPDFSTFCAGGYIFQLEVYAPTDEDIKSLNDFFDNYGYNVSQYMDVKLKVDGRFNFTYVKTKDAQVKCVNMNAAQQMAAMLNGGCRFWVGEIGT